MDAVSALAAIREKGLAAEADALEAAIDEALCDEPIVRMAGSPTADQIADAVVAKLLDHAQVIGAKLVQKAASEVMSPLPWFYDERSDVLRDADDEVVADLGESSNQLATDRENGRAIVEAVNAYFAPAQPPTPADAATANAETQIPDTAGYPVPDYDAVDIPSVE